MPLGSMCLPLYFRFPFGTNFLGMYALQSLVVGAQPFMGSNLPLKPALLRADEVAAIPQINAASRNIPGFLS